MPTINNATVATGTGLSTAGNGGRKLVRLSNGWLVAAFKTGADCRLMKSLDNGVTWSNVSFVGNSSAASFSFALASRENRVFLITTQGKDVVEFYSIDVISISNIDMGTSTQINFTRTLIESQNSINAVSLAINDAGTELHAAWSSKNSTYSSSFNIRYAKGTIAADGSVTWGAVVQITAINATGADIMDPTLSVDSLGYPHVIVAFKNTPPYFLYHFTTRFTTQFGGFNGSTAWGNNQPYNAGGSFVQASIASMFVPQSINGLANGRLWVAWHGKDATDSTKFNIRTSYSDDGGATWVTPTKQTTGNLYDQTNASLTADAQGKVLLTWDAQNATTTQTALKVFNGTWGATTTLTGDGYTNASTLFDNTFKLSMTTPPLIRQSTSGVYFSGNYFTGASVAPASGTLGDKTASSVLSYTVTPESGSTVTSIVEKVNGTTVNTYSNPASLSRTFTIPLANWDALKYYNTHTISVTVTDSNGMANTQVYSFNKALANDAPLFEGAKAAKDGKDRISTKRDGIAGQVGLPAGSTFDAISAHLASGQAMVKRQAGTAMSTAATISGYSYVTIPFSAIGFVPKSISIKRDSSGVLLTHCNIDSYFFPTSPKYYSFTNNFGALLDGTSWYVNESGVQLAIGTSLSNIPVTWIAYG